MSLEEVVNVAITAETKTVSRKGFGTPLIAAYHTEYLDRVRTYSSLKGLTDDGFAATDPVYRCAAKILGQNPRVKTFKVGRRATAPTQKFRLVPTSTTVGFTYRIDFVRQDGTAASVSYTVQNSDTVALIIDGLIAAIAALSPALGATTTDNTTNFEVTASAGTLLDCRPGENLTLKDVTTDPGIATDLSAILTADADWYGLCLDSNSEAEGLAAAAWAEANKKLFATNSADTEILDSGTTNDYFSDLHAASYARTFGIWNRSVLSYAGAAWLGNRLPSDPGTATWAFKTLAGVTVDTLTTSQKTVVAGDGQTTNGKGGNHYTQLGGVNVTRWGKTFADEFIDVTIYIDFLEARIQEDVFAVLVNRPKVPYTDAGVDLIRGVILARLQQGVEAGALAASPAPTVTAPLVADISSNDRAARLLPDVEFSARLAGAIHTIDIAGSLTV